MFITKFYYELTYFSEFIPEKVLSINLFFLTGYKTTEPCCKPRIINLVSVSNSHSDGGLASN